MKNAVALLCVGSELLRGKLNTHAATLSKRLPEVGFHLAEESTVPDNLDQMISVLSSLVARYPIVIITGGLGPTFDDLSREAAEAVTKHPLVLNPKIERALAEKFRKVGYAMPSNNLRQAYLLKDADEIPNGNGTAPGQWLKWKLTGKQATGKQLTENSEQLLAVSCPLPAVPLPPVSLLILLPGPPRELVPMLDHFVLPRLKKMAKGARPLSRRFHFVGIPESVVDEKVRLIISAQPPSKKSAIDFTILAHLGLVDFEVYMSGAGAAKILEAVSREVQKLFPEALYGLDDEHPLEKVVATRFLKKKQTLAVAESCTGGMLSERLTAIPGSSGFFQGGVISYSNEVKARELGVPQALLKKEGAVSRPVAEAMAKGLRQRYGVDVALSITGIAGPGGGSAAKPVGLVYIGLSTASKTTATEFRFRGDRDDIRFRSVVAALDLLRSGS